MSMARRERLALADAMIAAGPDASTLCGEWTVRDLAAHLVVRERRPDAAPGILIKQFAGHLDRVQAAAAQRPFPDLIDEVRSGPPWWSPLRPVDSVVNLSEMFIHHEDVRRAGDEWDPRELSAADQDQLWKLLTRTARMSYRNCPVTVVLEALDGRRVTAGAGDDEVVLRGEPAELLLHAFGRDQVRIEASGEPIAVEVALTCDRSV
ncbi:TIGR03085 family protein [Nocardia cyriacigeorgica]|uniref:TIGR03085 family protein n=1 Tax=Nocardia cyriacigeorgica TaxID=135487 RepID=A0A6P1D0R1_9NOCA|nr:TIGR03085 family metal-binding protein [Nocardia cyriacigeorgica]NEW39256.1 TIGR03085 family protein [Nocardia cyriacigeorgica]NEW43184.1 TIGR03085 family protein [Nocardia cyriacigeorgica]NEW49761.1 TIGR03085 family protein [Nocardia cyriacigeorgica]NEW54496.1 TIGR03085 family protein [Nocardia cyriacigeorgica]